MSEHDSRPGTGDHALQAFNEGVNNPDEHAGKAPREWKLAVAEALEPGCTKGAI